MIHHLFTIYDAKAEYYSTPFYARSTGEALRQFQEAANNPENKIGVYPEDFALFQIGEFDELSGEINLLESYKPLGRAIDYVQNTNVESLTDRVVNEGKN